MAVLMISFTVLILDQDGNYLPRKSSFLQLHYGQTFQVLREFLCPVRKRESIGEQNICVGGVSGGTNLNTGRSKRQKGTPQSSSKCWVMSRAPLILSISLSSKCKLRKCVITVFRCFLFRKILTWTHTNKTLNGREKTSLTGCLAIRLKWVMRTHFGWLSEHSRHSWLRKR